MVEKRRRSEPCEKLIGANSTSCGRSVMCSNLVWNTQTLGSGIRRHLTLTRTAVPLVSSTKKSVSNNSTLTRVEYPSCSPLKGGYAAVPNSRIVSTRHEVLSSHDTIPIVDRD